MDDRNRGWFWLILLLVAALTALYVQRRDLPGRYMDHQKSAAELTQARQSCAELEGKLEASRQRADHLGSDPTEIEGAIRRSKDLVREGETVFRIEKAPRDAQAYGAVPR
jgi:cell division protein FtsB